MFDFVLVATMIVVTGLLTAPKLYPREGVTWKR